jgi:hypothetical protein
MHNAVTFYSIEHPFFYLAKRYMSNFQIIYLSTFVPIIITTKEEMIIRSIIVVIIKVTIIIEKELSHPTEKCLVNATLVIAAATVLNTTIILEMD